MSGSGHGDHHQHVHERVDVAANPQIERALWIAVAVCAVATLLGLLFLWPDGGRNESVDPLLLAADPVEAQVLSDEVGPCSYDATIECRFYAVEVVEGPDRGGVFDWEQSVDSAMRSGDDILVIPVEAVDGTVTYSFYEFQRSRPMWILVGLFVIAVLALGRLRGLGALGGLAASLGVVVVFMIPSLLDGNNTLAVALVAASTVAFIAIYLAHGFNVASTVALLSTFASLGLTGLLAFVFVRAGKLTGFTEDSAFMLSSLGLSIDARGILLAGIVLGSLGVLDDVTVTQVSTVGALRRADPNASSAELYRAALAVGRDHVSSTVNTLFLAYVGAALPLLLLFTEAQQSVGSVATREIVATEIVRALVGSIGLVASVPIATGLAAAVYRHD